MDGVLLGAGQALTLSARVLYISYDGLLEPLGRSQVLQYLRVLARTHHVVLLTFEKSSDWARVEERERLRDDVRGAGIRWTALRYHKRPSALATTWDIFVGSIVGLALVLRHRIRLVHARSYVAASIALVLKRLTRTRFIFDMRGFWADERVDGGIWPRDSRLYRVAKWFERRFLRRADAIVSLTQAGASAIRALPVVGEHHPPVVVIPTCTNLQLFRPRPATVDAPFTLGYVGTVGTWYLFDPVLQAFSHLRALRPGSRLLILNRGEHEFIKDRLSALRIPLENVELSAVGFDRVAESMAGMDAGIFFIRPSYSKLASAPTKLGEFLACGIPCLSNAGVGDVRDVLEGHGVGVALESLDDDALRAGVVSLLDLAADPAVRARCVDVAARLFSLDRGVDAYDALYESLSAART